MKKYILSIFLAGLSLMGYAQTASDKYLDIANYASIDDAGWNTSLVDYLYQYNKYESSECAWLTLSAYGAFVGASYAKNSDNIGSGHPQSWIGTNIESTSGSPYTGNQEWSSNSPFMGNTAYFEKASKRVIGDNSRSGTTARTVTFNVTNITEVQLYSKFAKSTDEFYSNRLQVTECALNGNTVVPNNNTRKEAKFYTYNGKGTIKVDNLDSDKIYQVVIIVYRGYLYEVAFKTPLPKLSATPTDLTFEYDPNQRLEKTFTVTGSNVKGGVSMALNAPDGGFSLSPNTITVNNNKTVNQEVTVTFNPGTTNRVYEGSVTLSSQGVDDVVINLKALPNKFPVTISTYGVSTLYLDYPVEIPYDTYDDLLGVFYAHEYTENELKMARIRKVIPANEGVVVEGNAGTYEFPRYKEDDVDNYKLGKPNLLKGSVVNIQKSAVLAEAGEGATVMTLGFGKSGYVGFYAYSGSVLTANKAFLIYTPPTNNNSVNSLSISGMGGDYTGISEMRANHNDDAWYTLQGVRLNGSPKQHGIYIHNGKTVVVK